MGPIIHFEEQLKLAYRVLLQFIFEHLFYSHTQHTKIPQTLYWSISEGFCEKSQVTTKAPPTKQTAMGLTYVNKMATKPLRIWSKGSLYLISKKRNPVIVIFRQPCVRMTLGHTTIKSLLFHFCYHTCNTLYVIYTIRLNSWPVLTVRKAES